MRSSIIHVLLSRRPTQVILAVVCSGSIRMGNVIAAIWRWTSEGFAHHPVRALGFPVQMKRFVADAVDALRHYFLVIRPPHVAIRRRFIGWVARNSFPNLFHDLTYHQWAGRTTNFAGYAAQFQKALQA